MAFRPLHDRVVVRRIEAEEKSAGGIIIPDTAKEKPQEGEVIAVGPGARDESGKLVPPDVKAGDRVLFGKWSGNRGSHRWPGSPHHEGVRHHGCDREDHFEEEGRQIGISQSQAKLEFRPWLPKTSDFRPMRATDCCAGWTSSPMR